MIRSRKQGWAPGAAPALPLDRLRAREARHPAQRRPAGVRHPARGGLRARQAARHGLRDDHRPRHDRRRLRSPTAPTSSSPRSSPPGSRASPRRCTSSPRHHARRPRVAAGPHPRRRALRGVPARARDHLRARAPVLRGRGAAEPAPPPPPRRAVPGLGDRNGSRAHELNMPAAVYIETHGGTGVGSTTTPESTSGAPTPRRRR